MLDELWEKENSVEPPCLGKNRTEKKGKVESYIFLMKNILF